MLMSFKIFYGKSIFTEHILVWTNEWLQAETYMIRAVILIINQLLFISTVAILNGFPETDGDPNQ